MQVTDNGFAQAKAGAVGTLIWEAVALTMPGQTYTFPTPQGVYGNNIRKIWQD